MNFEGKIRERKILFVDKAEGKKGEVGMYVLDLLSETGKLGA